MAKKEDEKKDPIAEMVAQAGEKTPMSKLALFVCWGAMFIAISFGSGYACFISSGWLAGWLGTFSVFTFIGAVVCFVVAFLLALGVTAEDMKG